MHVSFTKLRSLCSFKRQILRCFLSLDASSYLESIRKLCQPNLISHSTVHRNSWFPCFGHFVAVTAVYICSNFFAPCYILRSIVVAFLSDFNNLTSFQLNQAFTIYSTPPCPQSSCPRKDRITSLISWKMFPIWPF